jgi:hypothetical protein
MKSIVGLSLRLTPIDFYRIRFLFGVECVKGSLVSFPAKFASHLFPGNVFTAKYAEYAKRCIQHVVEIVRPISCV